MEIFSIVFNFILHIDVHLGEIIARYGILSYGILFAIIFAETGLMFTPPFAWRFASFCGRSFLSNRFFQSRCLASVSLGRRLFGRYGKLLSGALFWSKDN